MMVQLHPHTWLVNTVGPRPLTTTNQSTAPIISFTSGSDQICLLQVMVLRWLGPLLTQVSPTPNNNLPINSTHHQLYFWFRSDQSIVSDGFTVAWTSANQGKPRPLTTINQYSTHHQLHFRFRSDRSIASDDFTVAWTFADPGKPCPLTKSTNQQHTSSALLLVQIRSVYCKWWVLPLLGPLPTQVSQSPPRALTSQ